MSAFYVLLLFVIVAADVVFFLVMTSILQAKIEFTKQDVPYRIAIIVAKNRIFIQKAARKKNKKYENKRFKAAAQKTV